MPMMTPWGVSDGYPAKLIRGVNIYGTPSHGGFCVSRKLAEKRLSKYALNKAIKYGNGYWFEEDCDYAFVAYEIPEVLDAMNSKLTNKLSKEDCYNTIKRYNSDYGESNE